MVLNAQSLAAQRPEEIALRDRSRALTWDEVDDLANRLANGLHRLLADSAQRRIALFATNSYEVLLVHLAALNAGASIALLSYHLKEDEAEYILRDSGAEVVFVSPETVAVAMTAAKRAGTPTLLGWRGAAGGPVLSFEDWLREQPAEAPPTDIQSLPNVMYTSGTTGLPKRVESPPIVFTTGTVAEYIGGLGNFHYFMNERTHLVSGPLYHTAPMISARLLTVGKPVIVMERFEPERFLELVERYRVESTMMVPTHFRRLLALPDETRARYDVSSLKLVVHTGSACPQEVKRAMIEWFGPVFYESYGGTEAGTICRIGSQDWLEHPGSVGRVQRPFGRVVVVDEAGTELPAGQVGRLYFEDPTGRGIVYAGDEQKTRDAHLRPGVFTLGDVGYVDDDGFVFVTDRMSDMIISGGVNVYPAEAEKVLGEHPAVADVAVIGVPDALMGESVLALVVIKDPEHPVGEAELIAYCRARLAGFKCPKAVELVEDLGRNSAGKISKRRLREPYWTGGRMIG